MLEEEVRNSCTYIYIYVLHAHICICIFMHMYVYRTRFLYNHDIELYKFRQYIYIYIYIHIYLTLMLYLRNGTWFLFGINFSSIFILYVLLSHSTTSSTHQVFNLSHIPFTYLAHSFFFFSPISIFHIFSHNTSFCHRFAPCHKTGYLLYLFPLSYCGICLIKQISLFILIDSYPLLYLLYYFDLTVLIPI